MMRQKIHSKVGDAIRVTSGIVLQTTMFDPSQGERLSRQVNIFAGHRLEGSDSVGLLFPPTAWRLLHERATTAQRFNGEMLRFFACFLVLRYFASRRPFHQLNVEPSNEWTAFAGDRREKRKSLKTSVLISFQQRTILRLVIRGEHRRTRSPCGREPEF